MISRLTKLCRVSRPSISEPIQGRQQPEDPKRLLARFPAVRNACDLDLLVFLHRHPRTLLTNEQLAKFAGYGMKEIARTLECFVETGILERTAQPSAHAARMYLLVFGDPHGGGLRTLMDLASTWQGRRQLLGLLNGHESAKPNGVQETQQSNLMELRRR